MRIGERLGAIAHELRHRRRRRRPSATPTLAPHALPLVTMICVSKRPQNADAVLAMFRSQTWPSRELILIANSDTYRKPTVAESEPIRFLQTPDTVTLGACLNIGLDLARGEIFAKIDDDDRYQPHYLADIVDVFRTVEAHVTGKCSYRVHLLDSDRHITRFPDRANQYVGRVAGGTIAAFTAVTRGIRFPDKNLGEDVEFVRRCERAGLRIWGSDPGGFTQVRSGSGDHTWEIADDDLL